ncbi:MAG: lipoprotein, partial [Bradymonadia bacterium]
MKKLLTILAAVCMTTGVALAD